MNTHVAHMLNKKGQDLEDEAAADRSPRVALDLAPATDGVAPLDFDQFADTMAALAATVCIVTAGRGEERVGRTVTSIMSLTAEPPTVMVSITRGSALAQAILEEGGFSLAMLAQTQGEIGNVFAGKLPPLERFSQHEWRTWPSGRPRLEGAAAAIDCALAGTVEVESHCLFAGTLIDAVKGDHPPLVWHDRGYRQL